MKGRKDVKGKHKSTSQPSKDSKRKSKVKKSKPRTKPKKGANAVRTEDRQNSPSLSFLPTFARHVGKRVTLNGHAATIKAASYLTACVKSKTERYEYSWHAVDYAVRESGGKFIR